MLLAAAGSLAQEGIRSSDSREAEVEVSTDTIISLDDDAEESDPCVMEKDQEIMRKKRLYQTQIIK